MDGGPALDAWGRYRLRVERENPTAILVRFQQQVEQILEGASVLDDQVSSLSRSVAPEEFARLTSVLTLMRNQQFSALRKTPDNAASDYGEWFAAFVAQLAAGEIDAPSWKAADRMAILLSISQKVEGARQVRPALPRPEPPNIEAPRDPAIVAATHALFSRYGVLMARLTPVTADDALDADLQSLLADYQALAERCAPASKEHDDLQWACAMVTGSIARCAALRADAPAAKRWFGEAAQAWSERNEPPKVEDSLTRQAEAALADGADVDEALEGLLAELDRLPAAPTLARARLLTRLAVILAGASASFDAAQRVLEASQTLASLGFVDPTAIGLDAAFGIWVGSGHQDATVAAGANATLAQLSSVATIWSSLTGARVDLTPDDRRRSGVDVPTSALTDLLEQLGFLTERLGREADAVGRRISEEARALGLGPLLNQAEGEALATAQEEAAAALHEATSTGADLIRLQDRYNQSTDRAALEDLLAPIEELRARARAAQTPIVAATAAVLHADTLSYLGRLDACVAVLQEALSELQAAGNVPVSQRRSTEVTILQRSALAHAMRHDLGAFSNEAGKGIALVELDRGKVNDPYLQDDYLRTRRILYDLGVYAAYQLGDLDLMLRRADLAKARGVLGWATSDYQGEPPALDAAEADLRALLETPGGKSETEQRARRRALWGRLMAARAREGTRPKAPTFTLAALQAALGDDEAVIYYYWVNRSVLLLATIDRTRAAVDKIDLGASRDDLGQLVVDLASLVTEMDWLDEELPPLGDQLLPREGADILVGKRRLIISPQGVLHQLPFHAFHWHGVPFIERFAVSYIPNLSSFLLPRRRSETAEVLTIGISATQGLRPLPNAALEAADIASVYQRAATPATALADNDATRARVRGLQQDGTLRRLRALHLAAHGASGPPDDPFAARLFLSDGAIDGLEISGWDLHADLVVLSACYSGQQAISGRHDAGDAADAGTDPLFGDEVFGLQAAFFSAGAHEVLGALWPANDTAARAITTAMHQHVADGLPTDEALQRAMVGYRAAEGSIYRWAPFKLIRLGRITAGANPPTKGRN